MGIRFSICLLLACGFVKVLAQSPELDQPAVGFGPFLAVDQSPWSLYGNMAGLAGTNSWQATMGYYSPYGLPELRSLFAGAIIPVKPLLGISFSQNGGKLLTNQQLALNSQLSYHQLDLGLRVRYWKITTAGQEGASGASLDLGLQLKLSDKIRAGAFFSNVTHNKIGEAQTFPVVMATGVNYLASDKVRLLFETAHRLGEVLELKVGVTYQIKEKLILKSGLSSYSRQSYFGLNIISSKLEIDYVLSVHLNLGLVHHAGITYTWS